MLFRLSPWTIRRVANLPLAILRIKAQAPWLQQRLRFRTAKIAHNQILRSSHTRVAAEAGTKEGAEVLQEEEEDSVGKEVTVRKLVDIGAKKPGAQSGGP